MYTSTILVGDEYLGTIEYSDASGRDRHVVSHGIAYFCQDCGEVWARLISVGPRGQGKFFTTLIPCAQHSDGWNLPGSLLGGMMEQILRDLPPDAVRREFNLFMKKYESEL